MPRGSSGYEGTAHLLLAVMAAGYLGRSGAAWEKCTFAFFFLDHLSRLGLTSWRGTCNGLWGVWRPYHWLRFPTTVEWTQDLKSAFLQLSLMMRGCINECIRSPPEIGDSSVIRTLPVQ